MLSRLPATSHLHLVRVSASHLHLSRQAPSIALFSVISLILFGASGALTELCKVRIDALLIQLAMQLLAYAQR